MSGPVKVGRSTYALSDLAQSCLAVMLRNEMARSATNEASVHSLTRLSLIGMGLIEASPHVGYLALTDRGRRVALAFDAAPAPVTTEEHEDGT